MAKWQRNPTGRIAYVNGRYLPHAEAGVHIEDRALQLGDGIYEVTNVIGGKPIDEEPHLDRMERSLRELGIAMPMGRAALKLVMREMIARNRIANGLLYLQVTRGAARRDHVPPKNPPRPRSLACMCSPTGHWNTCAASSTGPRSSARGSSTATTPAS